MITRRIFLKNGGLTLVGMGMVPTFLLRTALGAPGDSRRKKILIAVFQRGGVDGLNTVVPFGEKEYYSRRSTIAIPAPKSGQESALDLNGFFGLHPSLEPLLSLYKKGELAIIHAAGSPNSTRSHFDAQDFMESAAPGDKKVSDGWLNRYLQQNPEPKRTSFRGVAMGTRLSRSLKGKAAAIALANINAFDLNAGRARKQVRSAYQTLYDQDTNSLLSGTAREMFEAIDFLKKADPGQYQPAAGVEYPPGRFGQSLKQVVQLIKADIGLEVAFVDIGGWDHHINEGGINGQLSNRLREFGQGLAALHRDLDDQMEDVVVLTMSEFGRTVHENGNAGTDHGHANVMFVLGGPVKGAKVYGDWPGLAPEQLYEGRDLALTTDFRDVFAEALVRHLSCKNANAIFPNFTVDEKRFKGML
ncbi:DUF1501 domain-containing protein [Acidobacteria bacterium AH-259-L09]|nr:DUF1501 domain-containing protein [Acidobacteria bacterium AH-259-L09]